MNAREVIDSLVGSGAARKISVVEPFSDGCVLAGIEVLVTGETDERRRRRLWRERHGGGAVPLMIVSDGQASGESLHVLGLSRSDGPMYSIRAVDLAAALRAVGDRPRLEAVRELTLQLDQLDQAGIAGLRIGGLLTTHTLDVRLRNDGRRWSAAEKLTSAIGDASDWRALFVGFGYEIERRPRRGHLLRYHGSPVAVVHPKADPVEFSRLDDEGRPAEGVLLNDCRHDGAAFGILASGGRVRLFEAASPSGSTSSYLEIDTQRLGADDRPFLALLSPTYLVDGEFERLQAEARRYGAALRVRLDNVIRQEVLPELGLALTQWADHRELDKRDDAARADLESAALTLVFRLLFIMFAESAGYLPTTNRTYQPHSLGSLAEEAASTLDALSDRSTSLWDRFFLLVKAMRDGNPAWAVPAYNGSLFAADGFEGSLTLEDVSLPDPQFGRILVALGIDPDIGRGIDYSTLEIGHLGHLYEGLLSLRLAVADRPLRYRPGKPGKDRYVEAADGEAQFTPGDLLWQTNEGGRKSGGVYYTRTELVRHLVEQAVRQPFAQHLESVAASAEASPAVAAQELFDFAVLDPACGSAHFLVEVVDTLADMVVRFLADRPLPQVAEMLNQLRAGATPDVIIEDASLIRRLVLKRCVFGVDVSPMGAEVAKMSLWLATFVPGLSLSYLGRNVVVGNSLVGVARPDVLHEGEGGAAGFWDDALETALTAATEAVARVADLDDRNPEEVLASQEADSEARLATAGLTRLFDMWTAEPFGVVGARDEVRFHKEAILDGSYVGSVDASEKVASGHRFLHWPVEFPRVFARPRPGFDAVIGNPPWEELTVEALAFYGRYEPGIRALGQQARDKAVADLLRRRPELAERLELAQARLEEQRGYYPLAEYEPMPGDPDLYKFFCQRYRTLVRDEGRMGVVLPRSAFMTDGSEGFRQWLFEDTTCFRIDFLVNKGRWAFDSEPRYTVGLVAAERALPPDEHRITVAGVADSLDAWVAQAGSGGVSIGLDVMGPGLMTPLLRDQAEADLLAKLRKGSLFPCGTSGRWRCVPVRELDETNHKNLWKDATEGRPLWKGESFDQYDPHGGAARLCPTSDKVWEKVKKKRPGQRSILSNEIPVGVRRAAVLDEIEQARVAFRDVSRATDSRTVRAALVPPRVFLTNTAPYLAFIDGDDRARAACLGILNSLPFDWQARRFVETHVNFFILEGLVVPDMTDEDFSAIGSAAARLSSPDERFGEFAEGAGVDVGPLSETEATEMRIEIDARIARAWGLDEAELATIFVDFSYDAVPRAYREALVRRLKELS